jgi:hypothetical protein
MRERFDVPSVATNDISMLSLHSRMRLSHSTYTDCVAREHIRLDIMQSEDTIFSSMMRTRFDEHIQEFPLRVMTRAPDRSAS